MKVREICGLKKIAGMPWFYQYRIDNHTYEFKHAGEALFSLLNIKSLTDRIIRDVCRQELAGAKNQTDAILNTAVVLGISERTVWRGLEKRVNP